MSVAVLINWYCIKADGNDADEVMKIKFLGGGVGGHCLIYEYSKFFKREFIDKAETYLLLCIAQINQPPG